MQANVEFWMFGCLVHCFRESKVMPTVLVNSEAWVQKHIRSTFIFCPETQTRRLIEFTVTFHSSLLESLSRGSALEMFSGQHVLHGSEYFSC